MRRTMLLWIAGGLVWVVAVSQSAGQVARVDPHAGDAKLYVVGALHIAGRVTSPVPIAWAAWGMVRPVK